MQLTSIAPIGATPQFSFIDGIIISDGDGDGNGNGDDFDGEGGGGGGMKQFGYCSSHSQVGRQ